MTKTSTGGNDRAPNSRRARRSDLGGTQIEGRQAVRELLLANRRRVTEIWMVQGQDPAPILHDIELLAKRNHVPVRLVSKARLMGEARSDASQGMLAHAEALEPLDIEDLCKTRQGAKPFLLLLDGVTDPHNVGALMRSAEGAGVTGVVLPEHKAANLSPVVAKAAAGAIEYLQFALVPGIAGAVARLKELGVWTVGLDGSAKASLFDLNLATEPIALVVGAEGAGLSKLVEQRCDMIVNIPQLGKLQSLNVASAGTLACYEVARRRA